MSSRMRPWVRRGEKVEFRRLGTFMVEVLDALPNGVEIFWDDDDTQCGEEAVSQMPKSSVNEGVWPKVRQFRKETCDIG